METEFYDLFAVVKRMNLNRVENQLISNIYFEIFKIKPDETLLSELELCAKLRNFIDYETKRLIMKYIRGGTLDDYKISIKMNNVGKKLEVIQRCKDFKYDELFEYIKRVTFGRLINMIITIQV